MAKNCIEITWKTLWEKPIIPLYKDLTKVKAIIIFFFGTEVIGLNIIGKIASLFDDLNG